MTCTEDRFYSDVRDHQMTILRDDGLYRHLTFRNPQRRWCYWFDLITWPGALAINGDMGSWVFQREKDMFAFMGMSEQLRRNLPRGKTLAINPQYWAEKLIARDKQSEVEEFSAGVFAQAIKERYVAHVRKNMCGADMRDLRYELRRAIEDLIDEYPDGCNGDEAIRAAYNFHWKAEYTGDHIAAYTDGRPHQYRWADFSMEDFWEMRCREYSHHYTWCLYAIVWGIWHYDQRNEYAEFWRAAA
jgi:hypothetical protein